MSAILLLPGGVSAYQIGQAPAPRPLMSFRTKNSPAMLALGASEVESVTSLIAETLEPLDATLFAQIGVSAGMCVVGNLLHAGTWGEVEEPQEVGVDPNVVDIYRDSPLRYMGYANECGEAFRPLVPVEVVYLTYFGAIAYILADTVDKGMKGAAVPGDDSMARGTLGALDTFFWQMLASVIFPSFCINRLVTLLFSLQQGDIPMIIKEAEFLPTIVGLVSIPLLVTPLDSLAHFTLNKSFRRVKSTIVQ